MEETSYVGLQRFCNISKHILPSAYTGGREGGRQWVRVLPDDRVRQLEPRPLLPWLCILIAVLE